jgi:RNA polymerase sigma-70 factor (ECF subfamily)
VQLDSLLHTRLLAGEQHAFEEFFAELNPTMLRVAQSITGNRATSEEVTQDAWLAVIEKLQSFNGDAPLRHWVLKIVSNKALTRATRDGKSNSLDTSSATSDVNNDAFASNGEWREPPNLWDELTPERILGGHQVLRLVHNAIKNLPPTQQALLALVEREKLSANQCAELLDISAGNVRVQLHRARETIRQMLDEQMDGENNL